MEWSAAPLFKGAIRAVDKFANGSQYRPRNWAFTGRQLLSISMTSHRWWIHGQPGNDWSIGGGFLRYPVNFFTLRMIMIIPPLLICHLVCADSTRRPNSNGESELTWQVWNHSRIIPTCRGFSINEQTKKWTKRWIHDRDILGWESHNSQGSALLFVSQHEYSESFWIKELEKRGFMGKDEKEG